MSTNDAQNGTGISVLMDANNLPGSVYVMIGGQNSHTLTLNNGIIDITNKSSASFRELLPDEGTQSLDLTVELTFNSEATFKAVRAMAGTKALKAFRIVIPTSGNIDVECMIASFAETSPDGDKLTASVSFQSSGSFTWV